jgi:GH18 family chitinase
MFLCIICTLFLIFGCVDIDWEYPAAQDRGGVPADTARYTIFMNEVKNAFGPNGYGLTFTAPSSYWYLQHFDLPGLMQSADWVNIMLVMRFERYTMCLIAS